MFTPIKTITVSKFKLKEIGIWEEVKRRCGLREDARFAVLFVGSKWKVKK